jgi:hypothetical protein
VTKNYLLPWIEITEDGIFIGDPNTKGSSNWIYGVIPNKSLVFLEDTRKFAAAQEFKNVFESLAKASRKPTSLANSEERRIAGYREIHVLSANWDGPPRIPHDATPAIRDFFNDVWTFNVFSSLSFIGVKLVNQIIKKGRPEQNIKVLTKRIAGSLLGEPTEDPLENFRDDIDDVKSIFAKAGIRPPTREEVRRLKSWYDEGKGNGSIIRRNPNYIEILSTHKTPKKIEFSWLSEFGRDISTNINNTWVSTAMTYGSSSSVVSIRGYLEPAAVTQSRLRKAQGKHISNIGTTEQVGLPKLEQLNKLDLAAYAENYLASTGEPTLVSTTVTFAVDIEEEDQPNTYQDHLLDDHDLVVRPSYYRQMGAFEECLPGSGKVSNPFKHTISLDVIASSGISSVASLGDKSGIWVGFAEPEMSMVFLDPERSAAGSAKTQNPMVSILGDPGSGKTFLMQLVAIQSALLKRLTVFINPKPQDDLSGMANLLNRWGVSSEIIFMGDLEAEPGSLDPFGYTDPRSAATIAATHIMTVLKDGFTLEQESYLEAGLIKGAESGAKCVYEALKYVNDPKILSLIKTRMDASAVFRLGIATTPLKERVQVSKGLTLIQFDKAWNIPEGQLSSLSLAEKDIVAAYRLVPTISLEMLLGKNRSGTLIADEAHHLLSQESGNKFLTLLGRYGRSQRIMAVMGTHKASEVESLAGFMGRIIALQMLDKREAVAALNMVGLEPSPENIAAMATFGPKAPTAENPSAKGAQAFLRDMDLNIGRISIQNIPEWLRRELSTSSVDREKIGR